VLKGRGNNTEDQSEGAIYRNTYGTYLHGSLLPKNPHFADHLIALALQRKYGLTDHANMHSDLLKPLEDTLEWKAHASILERLGLYDAATAALGMLKR
jgi:hypothetical protein